MYTEGMSFDDNSNVSCKMLNEKPVSTQFDDNCDYSVELSNETPMSEYHNVS